MHLKRMSLVFLSILVIVLMFTGCFTGRDSKNSSSKNQPEEKQHQQPADVKENLVKANLQIFFARHGQGKEEIAPVNREVEVKNKEPVQLAKKAFKLLQAGPTAEEKEQGLYTNIPSAQMLDIEVIRPNVILNLSKEFEQVGGTCRVGCIIDQLTYTMSAIPGIKSVILKVEGEKVGTSEHPYTGEGFLFHRLTVDPDSELALSLGPADTLDLFIAVIPEAEKMWALMGPRARGVYKQPGSIETSAFEEGLGKWKNYSIIEEKIEGDSAKVIIKGDQVSEGVEQKDATYTAHMVRENGRWKWDFPPS